MQDFVDMGVNVLNPLQSLAKGMDLPKIKREYSDILSFHGAIDIQQTLPIGTAEEVQKEVRNRVDVLGEGGGYIMCMEFDGDVENGLPERQGFQPYLQIMNVKMNRKLLTFIILHVILKSNILDF